MDESSSLVRRMMSLDGVRWRSDLSCRFALVGTGGLFCLSYLRRERRAVADSVAVSEVSVLPFFLKHIKGFSFTCSL